MGAMLSRGVAEDVGQVPVLMAAEEFREKYGTVDDRAALSAFTPAVDTQAVLALLMHHRPKRILEIGTAAGHMTANMSEWSSDDTKVFSIGIVAGQNVSAPAAQRVEDPPEAAFGKEANHFGKGHKVTLVAEAAARACLSPWVPRTRKWGSWIPIMRKPSTIWRCSYATGALTTP